MDVDCILFYPTDTKQITTSTMS